LICGYLCKNNQVLLKRFIQQLQEIYKLIGVAVVYTSIINRLPNRVESCQQLLQVRIVIAELLISIAYVAAQMMADIASLQIVQFAGLSMDAGTFVYPITFTLRDLAHKVIGIRGARILIIAAAVVNLVMALFFWFVGSLTPDAGAGSSELWGQVLSPIWRITMASIVAEVVAELVDTEAYRFWVERITRRFQWLRVLTSNAISIPVDSFLFAFLAFYGTMPTSAVIGIFWANVIVKGAVTIVSLPMIYLVREQRSSAV